MIFDLAVGGGSSLLDSSSCIERFATERWLTVEAKNFQFVFEGAFI